MNITSERDNETATISAGSLQAHHRKRGIRRPFARELNAISSTEQESKRRRIRLLRAIVSLPEKSFDAYPGAAAFVRHLEENIEQLQETVVEPFLAVIRAHGNESHVDAHDVLLSTAMVFNETVDGETSLVEALDLVISRYGLSRSDMPLEDTGKRFLFAAVCWLTGTLNPSSETSSSLCITISPEQSRLRPRQSMDNAERPIGGLLRGFGNILPPAAVNTSTAQESQLLHASVLSFDSLSKIGKVKILWADTFSAHFEFHPLSRTLILYRFPSMCALHCLENEEAHCANKILKSYYSAHADSTLALTALRREILLTYRLVFGQSHRSRQLYNRRERKKAILNSCYDPFLDCLCGERYSERLRHLPSSIWPESCVNSEGFLQEQDVYNLEIDFPLLGQRILKLQEFNLRQRPSRIRDLWRDRRNPLQWYTFWAVLILGGVSLMFTVVQTFVAIAQLVIAIRGPFDNHNP